MSAQQHISEEDLETSIENYGVMSRLTLEQSVGALINNGRFCDVHFIVGDDETKINGHRMLFALSCDVFEKMFYGELKDTSDDIRISDITAIGFMNMVRFFYSKKLEIDLSEIYETLEAATKYMVSDLLLALHELVLRKVKDASSACLLFDQLIKIEKTFGRKALLLPLPMDYVKSKIEMNCVAAFASHSFEHIDQETLIQILKFDVLNIKETDLLKSCIRHVDVELKRRVLDPTADNKSTIFANVKNLIRFTDLNAMEFGKIAGIENYLSAVEISTIFLHLSVRSRPTINYLSPRNGFSLYYRVTANRTDSMDIANGCPLVSKVSVSVDKEIFISQLITFDLTYCCDLDFKICKDGEEILVYYDFVQAGNCMKKSKFFINFPIPLRLERETLYELSFKFNIFPESNESCKIDLSDNTVLHSTQEEEFITFTFSNSNNRHCVENVIFSRLPNTKCQIKSSI